MKTKGIYFLYRVVQALALPLVLLYFVWRGWRDPGYWRTLPQRFGFLPDPYKQTTPGAIWLHAVSMGEVLACLEFVRQLRREFPRTRLFVSTSTRAGRATADEKLQGLADGVFYFPIDYCFAVRRVLRALKPSLVVVAETEIWPNLFRETRRIEAGLAIVNGRISDRAFSRYLPWRWFFAHVLPHAGTILAQNATMRDRFIAIGAASARVHATGNLKYDFQPREAASDSPVRQFVERLHPRTVWIAASTMPPAEPGDPDEDDAVIEAFATLAARHPDLLLILVPRKPERFDLAAQKLAAAGLPFVRRSSLPETLALPGVLLLDSIGELSGLFSLATIVFMGGTLARRGGHNILEPAFFSKPVVVGPHMENFQEIADEFHAARALVPTAGAETLSATVGSLLNNPDGAAETGARALACASAKRGATARAVAAMRRLYDAGVPRYRPAWPWFPPGWLLAKLWKEGGRRRMRRDVLRRSRLRAPVVSVGNVTMGGTGKTPCALMLARALSRRGLRPGILTRGYGRTSPQAHVIAAPGAVLPPEHTGDEPQIFVRSGIAPVGIGADRSATGRLLEDQFGVGVVLLDDGFQHVRLLRQVDLVLVDALDPFAGGEVFPLGRLREPLAGLARADVFLITRSRFSDLAPAIERTLRRWNQRAPIFRGTVRPAEWVEYPGGRTFPAAEPPFRAAGAFCGLGNPASFRKTLRALGVEPAAWVEYDDHHRYRPFELRRIAGQAAAAGAEALVTTEKDAINLCEAAGSVLAPLPLYWLRVEMEVEDEAGFLDAIVARLEIHD